MPLSISNSHATSLLAGRGLGLNDATRGGTIVKFRPHLPVDTHSAQAQGLQLDEAGRILLVIQAAIVLKRGDALIVQAEGRLAANNDGIALWWSSNTTTITYLTQHTGPATAGASNRDNAID